jgi:hypothetical protein
MMMVVMVPPIVPVMWTFIQSGVLQDRIAASCSGLRKSSLSKSGHRKRKNQQKGPQDTFHDLRTPGARLS